MTSTTASKGYTHMADRQMAVSHCTCVDTSGPMLLFSQQRSLHHYWPFPPLIPSNGKMSSHGSPNARSPRRGQSKRCVLSCCPRTAAHLPDSQCSLDRKLWNFEKLWAWSHVLPELTITYLGDLFSVWRENNTCKSVYVTVFTYNCHFREMYFHSLM